MPEPEFVQSTFTRRGASVEARLSLLLDNHIEEVWTALTQPHQLVQWLAPGEIDLYVGGAAKLQFVDSGIVIDSQVTAYKFQQVLEYSWSGPGEPLRPLRWDLEPLGPLTRLTLTLRLPADGNVGWAVAGWAAHLDMLAATLAGAPTKFPFALFKAAQEAYSLRLAAA
ncbi:MAG TPA: SRPBCC domain-containing protein [Caulobacteraceae bacterium]|nr:SRPBCC domain-containing protein [Caulobacteraceae bacterium]